MATPFSLERQFRGARNIAQEQSRQDMFNKQAREATAELAKRLKEMQNEVKKESKGLFKSDFVKGLVSAGLSFVPGGQIINLALGAADLKKKQDFKKKQIEKAKKMSTGAPVKYKGTFLEDYLRGGIMGGAAQLQQNLEAQKDMGLKMGIASLIPTALGAAKSLPQAEQALRQAGKKVGQKIGDVAQKSLEKQAMRYFPKGLDSDKALNRLFAKIEKGIIERGKEAVLPANMVGPDKILPLTGSDMLTPNLAASIGDSAIQPSSVSQMIADFATKAGEYSVPYTGGLLKIEDLQTPLGMFATPLLSNYALREFTKPAGAPIMTEATAPRYY